MFRSSQNLRLAAEMRALERVARPWREARRTWFDGTPESIEARLASTERVLTYARAGMTQAHMDLTREASAARSELLEAKHRLLNDFLDDGARAFKGSKRMAGFHEISDPDYGTISSDEVNPYTGEPGGGAMHSFNDGSGPHWNDPRAGDFYDEMGATLGDTGRHHVDPDEPWRNTIHEDKYWDQLPTPDFAQIPLDGEYEGRHRASREASYPLGPGYDKIAVSAGGDNWPDDYPLPEGSSPIDNGDGTMTCPNCGYDEVKPNTSSTCPECDHYHENFLDDSDEAVGGFERAMERKYPILPEHGGPESGLWGGKWASHSWNHQ